MRNKFNILYVAPEVFPFTQSGALGEVSGALPKYLKNLGHDIRVIMPNYGSINERKYVLRDVIRLQGIKIKFGDDVYEASAKSAFIPDSKVQVYFLDNKHFFDREGLYFDDVSGKEYGDNAQRYIFFCKGCLEILKLLHWQPDIIHCNNWQTAIIPLLLKTIYCNDAFFKNTKTLFSFYNLSGAGVFESAVISKLGIPRAALDLTPLPENSHFDFLRMGLEFADLLNTSTGSFSKGVPEQYRNSELFDILKKRKDDIHGIGNGVDEQIWNPELDDLIPAKYGRRDLSGKIQNKEEVLKRFGLRASEKVPVISTISRHADDDVTDRLPEVIDQVLRLGVQLLIAGPAAAKHKKKLKAVQKEFPGQFGIEPNLDTTLLHLLVAGSDLCLIPAGFDSGGLCPLYSLAYGTIPIISKQSSGAENIEDASSSNGSGNGFILDDTQPKEILKVIKNIVKVYEKRDLWLKVIQNAMKQDLSWNNSAQKYIKLYQKLLTGKGPGK